MEHSILTTTYLGEVLREGVRDVGAGDLRAGIGVRAGRVLRNLLLAQLPAPS